MKTDELIALLGADNKAALASGAHARTIGMVLVGAAVLTVAAAFFGYYDMRSDFGKTSILTATLRKEAIAVTAAFAGIAMAVMLSRPLRNQTRLWLVPVLLLVGLVGWDLMADGLYGWQARLIGQNALACLAFIPLIAALPLVAILFSLRECAPENPAKAGAAAGFAAAGISAAIYALHCTDDSMLFVAVWYTLASVAVMTAGAWAGQRWLRW